MRKFAAALLLVCAPFAAQSAPPRGVAAEARVQWSHEPRETLIVGEQVWRCEGETCRGQVIDTPFLQVRACRAIARQVAGVADFSSASGPLTADELGRCNGRR